MEHENLSELSPVQQGFIRVIRGIEEEIGPTTTGFDVKVMVVEAYPPESLSDPDLAAYPKMYIQLRSWLDKHGAGLGQHPLGVFTTFLRSAYTSWSQTSTRQRHWCESCSHAVVSIAVAVGRTARVLTPLPGRCPPTASGRVSACGTLRTVRS